MQLAGVLKPDIGARLDAGTLKNGDSILATGKVLPSPYSVIEGQQVPWSRFVYLGGSYVFSGDALFRKFQGVYDPQLRWVRNQVTIEDPEYWDSRSSWSSNAYIYGFVQDNATSRPLITAGVVQATALLGNSSALLGTGMFTKSATLSDWLVKGNGIVLSEGIILSEGVVLSEGIILSEGIVVSEGIILTEGGQLQVGASSGSFSGEP
jgi:serine protease AprX